jgi:hypothetical protein
LASRAVHVNVVPRYELVCRPTKPKVWPRIGELQGRAEAVELEPHAAGLQIVGFYLQPLSIVTGTEPAFFGIRKI